MFLLTSNTHFGMLTSPQARTLKMEFKGLLQFTIPKNAKAFVVSDLGGNYDGLMQLLKSVDFNWETDFLISVGDLIDRGPNSLKLLKLFITEPRFYAALGNHEWMLVDAANETDPGVRSQKIRNWISKGGAWGAKVPNKKLKKVADSIVKNFYCAITVRFNDMPDKLIGITHADFPFKRWDAKTFANFDEYDYLALTCRRYRANSDPNYDYPVGGVEYTIHGHSRFERPTLKHNCLFIDTGEKESPTIVNIYSLLKTGEPGTACLTLNK
ncbi:MAG: hypothetical protein CMG75_08545 [Candidatus Marinimicrobia bacterium]|nr:hypothetical protein [Candidatus Neomarinimicrobiota bacterium]|tara:strand:- start:4763 stop:5569 length:807 start_codon:yes stop_codon:yes gene_type:complete